MNRRPRFLAAGIAVFVVGLLSVLVTSSGRTSNGDSAPSTAVTSTPSKEQPGTPGSDDRLVALDEGPEETAVAYATASQQWLYLTDEEIEAEVREIAVPSSGDRLVEETVGELGVARDGLMRSAGRVWWFVRPLATKTTSVTDTRAEVSVWVVTVLSAADVAVPQADWTTLDLVLVRKDSRWLLESIDDEPGPTPISGVRDEPWEPELFDDALDGFVRIGSEPK